MIRSGWSRAIKAATRREASLSELSPTAQTIVARSRFGRSDAPPPHALSQAAQARIGSARQNRIAPRWQKRSGGAQREAQPLGAAGVLDPTAGGARAGEGVGRRRLGAGAGGRTCVAGSHQTQTMG